MSVISSAWDAKCVLGDWSFGRSCSYRLKRLGDFTDPWGAPFKVSDVVMFVHKIEHEHNCFIRN